MHQFENKYLNNYIAMALSRGILQQCIKTISNIYPNSLLLQMAEDSLYKFFELPSHNMKYFGLDCLI